MAIREVLLSNTFEQQRQMINLIGTDIGDAALLVTPSKVLSTSINQVVAGFVTLSGQTIQLEDGTQSTPSLSFDSATNLGIYRVDANTLGISRNLFVASGLTVNGDITFRAGNGTGGTLTFGDLNTDNIVFNADVNSNIIPNTDDAYDLGAPTQEWRNLYIDGTAQVDTLQVDLNGTITGTLAVNGGSITTTASGVVSLFNTSATTINAFGDANLVQIGKANSTFELRSTDVRTTATSLNLFNTTTTSITAFGTASGITMGYTAASGATNTNFRIRSNDTVLDGDLNVNGGEILSSQNTFDLLINNADVRIGSTTGTTTVNNSLFIKGPTLNLSNQAVNISIKDNLNPALKISEGANDYLSVQTTDTLEKLIFHKNVSFLGNASLGDNDILYFGDGNDLQIVHNGSHSVIQDTGTGNLYIMASNQLALQSSTSENYLIGNADGAVELYFNNVKELETTAAGITVFGDITASGLTLNGNLTVNGTTTTINSTTLTVDDPLIVLGDGLTTAAAVNTGGFTLGTTGIGIQYNNGNTRFDSTEDFNLASGKAYEINGTVVLSATQVLGKGFTNAAGEIVTTDGTQTLTNKTINGATVSGSTIVNPTINNGSISGATVLFTNGTSTTDADATVDALASAYFSYIQSASATARTINISNLAAGRVVTLYLRNTNAGTKTINIAASTTATGFVAVNLSKGDAGGTSQTSVTLAATSGTAVVTVFNAGGVIGGSIS